VCTDSWAWECGYVLMAGLGNVGVYWQLGLGMWVCTDGWTWECGCVLTAGLRNVYCAIAGSFWTIL
jgi:hypothetical protein